MAQSGECVHRADALRSNPLDRCGLPPAKIVVKPHFVDPDPGPGERRGDYALFVGRLSSEKGVGTLLEAWRRMASDVPLRIVGDGPLRSEVAAAVTATPTYAGSERYRVLTYLTLLRGAAFLIFASEAYETFGRVVIEAFATGTPVIATGHGAAAELVRDGSQWLPFQPCETRRLWPTRSESWRRIRTWPSGWVWLRVLTSRLATARTPTTRH